MLRRRKSGNKSRVLQLPVSARRRPGAVVRVERAAVRLCSPLHRHLARRYFRRDVCRSRVPAAAQPRSHFRSRDGHRATMNFPK